jgi:hypothetical protein
MDAGGRDAGGNAGHEKQRQNPLLSHRMGVLEWSRSGASYA